MTNGNEPINPTTERNWLNQNDTEMVTGVFGGLTKREYFAAMAMQGILSNNRFTENAKEMAIQKGIAITEDAKELLEPFTKLAVDCADILIEQLNKTP